MPFSLTSHPLEPTHLKEDLLSSQAGAFSSFEGWVRDHNEGKNVTVLEYEAYAPLCQQESQKIFQEARQRFDILDMNVVHRIGKLKFGEMAVWVGVTAAHRDAAFKACRYLIDEIKHRLPIWKKEYYTNGDSGWVNCQHGSTNHVP